MPLVLGAVAPHGDLAIAELGTRESAVAAVTQAGMLTLESLARAARPDVIVIASPHHLHLDSSFGVITAGRIAGGLDGEAGTRIDLDCALDRELALQLLVALGSAGVPATGVSYGGNMPEEALMPMDWGTLIPLWYLGGRWDPPLPVVLLTPARDLGGDAHVRAGEVVGRVALASDKRIAFVASADQSHTHDASGPYGFSPAAAVFDRLAMDAIRDNALERLVDLGPDLLDAAKPDSWWQMLMLHGALEASDAVRWRSTLIAYEAPTYYGMLCAAFEPRP